MDNARLAEHERLARLSLTTLPGGPPERIPESMYDMPAVLARWLLILQYQADTGELWDRYFVMTHDIRNFDSRQYVATKRAQRANVVIIDKIRVPAARLVWLLHQGEWPDGPLQRRDGDNFNDRIENLYLRSAEYASPAGRPRIRPKGVSRFYTRWQAMGDLPDGRKKYLGRFDTEAEAIAARARWDLANDLV